MNNKDFNRIAYEFGSTNELLRQYDELKLKLVAAEAKIEELQRMLKEMCVSIWDNNQY